MTAHTEGAFEAQIEQHLVLNGYQRGVPSDYDKARAILPTDLFGFIKSTQPKAWAAVHKIHGSKLHDVFLDALAKELSRGGALNALRRGFKFYGQLIRLAFFRPAHGLNVDVLQLYDQNRLTVVRQVHFDPKNPDLSLDIVLFLNGLPIVTVELKNAMTGQTVHNAMKQYKSRDPNAPIFRFKERALVHFAVDTDEAKFTTRLAGTSTFFLPFNKGHNNGGGNPPVEGKHKTHYLWEEVWERHSLLDIVGRFMHLQVSEKRDYNTGKVSTSETIVFPRYHQLNAVRRLVSASAHNGAGTNYLIQHSTGSGKSNSIAWLAHRLASLHDPDDNKVFDSVIVVTDRKVLDQQLQHTIYEIDHKAGVVTKIDENSKQLANALQTGVQIIITTLHKFTFVTEQIGQLPDRNYAIIVDEAHSSQTGEMAADMKKVLSGAKVDQQVLDEMEALGDEIVEGDVYALALKAALSRGKRDNLSFYAFTATPKYKTLEMFGHTDLDGKPAPFHLYSMKQAIEEGFVHDVLKNYTTYETYFGLVKKVQDDPKLDKSKASKALVRFLSLHPHNISQKTEIIIEHFRANVMRKINGKAKAMVVTGSRLHAVRYKQAFDDYIKRQGYERDMSCLVAFSGTVVDPETEKPYTEVGMNDGIAEQELPGKFASDRYKLLLVANKYQTGFDQPLLHTMYVDKRLSGIQAVQTLSRLNRTATGKDDTFVLDFVNKREEILESFKPYYEATAIDEKLDPQKLYELKNKLDDFRVYLHQEVLNFAGVFFKAKASKQDHAKLNSYLDPAVDRYKQQEAEVQDDFHGTLNSFLRVYAFLSQITPFSDADLEMLYAFGRMLARKLARKGDEVEEVYLDEDVALQYYRIQKVAEGTIELEGGGKVSGPSEVGTGKPQELKIELSRLIDLLNERFGTQFTQADQLFFDQIEAEMKADESVRQAAMANDEENFQYPARKALEDVLLGRHQQNAELIDRVFADQAFGELVARSLLSKIYQRIRDETDL